MENELYVSCACTEYLHTVRYNFEPYEEGWPPELTVTMVLQDYASIWKRLWHAVRYIFRRKDLCVTICSIIRPEDIPKIKALFHRYIAEHNNFVSKTRGGYDEIQDY